MRILLRFYFYVIFDYALMFKYVNFNYLIEEIWLENGILAWIGF